MTSCGVTVLRTIGTARATKRWSWSPTLQQWRKISYEAGARFSPAEHQVANLAELVAVLDQVRRDPRAFVVRGALTDDARAKLADDPGHLIRRRKHRKGDVEPTLAEVPRRWLMVDVDNWPLPSWGDLADDPEAAIDAAIHELLPEAFHDATCWWQLSASAGFSPGYLKAHLFFWLAEPRHQRAPQGRSGAARSRCGPGAVQRCPAALHRGPDHRGRPRSPAAPHGLAAGPGAVGGAAGAPARRAAPQGAWRGRHGPRRGHRRRPGLPRARRGRAGLPRPAADRHAALRPAVQPLRRAGRRGVQGSAAGGDPGRAVPTRRRCRTSLLRRPLPAEPDRRRARPTLRRSRHPDHASPPRRAHGYSGGGSRRAGPAYRQLPSARG